MTEMNMELTSNSEVDTAIELANRQEHSSGEVASS